MMSTADDVMGESPVTTGVGVELREAREQLGWSLADVAANLRIRYVYLLALEEGRIADLPGIAYAVGFVRAYAKLLGLDPNVMSRRLRADVGADHRKPELEFPAPVPDRGVPAGVVVLLGVVLAIGAYVGWYRMSGDRPGPAPVQAVPDRLATLSEPSAKPPASKPEPEHAGTASSQSQSHGLGPTTPQATAQSASFSPIPPTSAAAAVPPSAGSPPGAAGSPSAPAGSASSLIVGNTPAPPPSADSPHIVLRAQADSWVQVRERQGQVLLNRVLRAGETWQVPQQQPGQPPLLLTTGNAGGTELLVDGVVAPSIGGSGVVKRDLPLDPTLIREGKLQSQIATRAPSASHLQPQ